jgi:hypothetical protein
MSGETQTLAIENRKNARGRGNCDYDDTLYVIFHGAIAFYDDPSVPWIEAMLVDLKDDHIYSCGKFFGETRIPRGAQLTLTGVTIGNDSFSNYKDFVHFTGENQPTPGAKVAMDTVYARYTLPRPYKIIHALNRMIPKKDRGKGDAQFNLCVVPVFAYRFADVDKLRLRMFLNYAAGCSRKTHQNKPVKRDVFPWTPTAEDVTPLTLHVHAEEDDAHKSPGPDHAGAIAILQDTEHENIDRFKQLNREDVPGLNGRTFWEIDLSLSDRVRWLEGVGSLIQDDPPEPGEDFDVTAPPSPSDHDASCGGQSGGPQGT